MGERPVIFNDEMVRAILDGRKTQTRRPIKPQPMPFAESPLVHAPRHQEPYLDSYCGERKTEANPRGMSDQWCWWTRDDRQGNGSGWHRCQFGVPGDTLWVRERTRVIDFDANVCSVRYEADGAMVHDLPWPDRGLKTPTVGNCMPNGCIKEASRLSLKVTGVRVERVASISEEDAKAEGVERHDGSVRVGTNHRAEFATLWDSIYAAKGLGWSESPWVWVVDFDVVE